MQDLTGDRKFVWFIYGISTLVSCFPYLQTQRAAFFSYLQTMPTLRKRLEDADVSQDALDKLSAYQVKLDVQGVQQAFLGMGDAELDHLDIQDGMDRGGIKSVQNYLKQGMKTLPCPDSVTHHLQLRVMPALSNHPFLWWCALA